MANKKIKKTGANKKNKQEKVCEVFEVEKKGKEEVRTACGILPLPHADKKELANQNRILRNVLLVIGTLIVLVFAFIIITNSMKDFEYNGVKYTLVKEGQLLLYNTKLPMYNLKGEHKADYNFYLRKDPRKTGEIPFDGNVLLGKNLTVDIMDDFNCTGDGMVLGISNLVTLFGVMNINVTRGNNESGCDLLGKESYILLRNGEENRITKTGPSCYALYIKDCDVLGVTERFMIETFSALQK